MSFDNYIYYPLSISSCILFAAKHHSAADIIVCLNLLEFVVTSQAAYNQSIEVFCLLSTIRHHSLSFSGFRFSTSFVSGSDQIATNIPSAFRDFHDLSLTSSINIVPDTSSTSSFNTSSIFSLDFICHIHMSSALKVSLR
jgi:hypothetical protein